MQPEWNGSSKSSSSELNLNKYFKFAQHIECAVKSRTKLLVSRVESILCGCASAKEIRTIFCALQQT